MKSYKNRSKNSGCINKQNYCEDKKIGIRNIHVNILQPTKEDKIAKVNAKVITNIPLKSIFELVKSVAAATPKNTCDEAIQKFAQYLLSSLKRFCLINLNLTKMFISHNGQRDYVNIFNYPLTAAQVKLLYHEVTTC